MRPLIIFVLLSLLVACGQTGPLYLPEKESHDGQIEQDD